MPGDTRETFVLIPEVDAAILSRLPLVGSKLGVKPLATQVKALSADLRDQGLTSAEISGRLLVLAHHDYVKKVIVMPVGGGAGWQVTEAGREFARKVENGEVE